jgi:uncharacterized protein (TIRG00374 family)
MIGHKVRMRGKQRLRAILSPKTLITTILGVIVLATLLSFSDIGKVWHIIEGFPPLIVPALFALVVVREILRSTEWRIFLNAIGIHASRREAFLTLAGGDAAQVIPGGLYFQDLLVSRELGASVTQPLAATTVMVWLEVTMAMLALGIFGLPSIPELRPIMAFCGAGSVITLLAVPVRLLERVRTVLCRWEARLGTIGRKLVDELDDFIGAFEGLAQRKVMLSGLVLCATYMMLTNLGFYLVCAGLGLPGIGPAQATAVYSLVLAVVIINPLPSDLGVSELSGVGGFLAFHVNPSDGLAAMLTFRILLLLSEEVVAGAAFLLFRRETLRLFRSGPATDMAKDLKK